MSRRLLTLTQHILDSQKLHPDATGQLSSLLTQIGVAGKLIQAQVRRAGIIEVWGATDETNVQNEVVQKLDRIANDALIDVLNRSGCVAAMASEEEHDLIEVRPPLDGDYVVLFDPLDGSSNIDANVSIGTIFSVYRRCDPHEVVRRDVLRPGREQVAAGYIVYGSSTVMVYTTGKTVDGFTLDPSAGEYFLTRPGLRMPQKTKVLSINECNEPYWPAWVRPYIDSVKARNDDEKRRGELEAHRLAGLGLSSQLDVRRNVSVSRRSPDRTRQAARALRVQPAGIHRRGCRR